jgi:hypothetical protein
MGGAAPATKGRRQQGLQQEVRVIAALIGRSDAWKGLMTYVA